MNRLLLLFTAAFLLAACGCNGAGNANSDSTHGTHAHDGEAPLKVNATFAGSGPIKVVCTTGMVADLARNIGGEHVEVSHLMGEGVDPHVYKASPGDVSRLNAADVIFYSGWHLEGKMGELFARMASRKPT